MISASHGTIVKPVVMASLLDSIQRRATGDAAGYYRSGDSGDVGDIKS